MSGHGYFPIKLYLQRQRVNQNCFSIHSLPTLDIEPCSGPAEEVPMSMWGVWMPPILQGSAQVWHFQAACPDSSAGSYLYGISIPLVQSFQSCSRDPENA